MGSHDVTWLNLEFIQDFFSLNSAHILGLIVTQKVKIKERNTSSDLSSIKPMSLVFV